MNTDEGAVQLKMDLPEPKVERKPNLRRQVFRHGWPVTKPGRKY